MGFFDSLTGLFGGGSGGSSTPTVSFGSTGQDQRDRQVAESTGEDVAVVRNERKANEKLGEKVTKFGQSFKDQGERQRQEHQAYRDASEQEKQNEVSQIRQYLESPPTSNYQLNYTPFFDLLSDLELQETGQPGFWNMYSGLNSLMQRF